MSWTCSWSSSLSSPTLNLPGQQNNELYPIGNRGEGWNSCVGLVTWIHNSSRAISLGKSYPEWFFNQDSFPHLFWISWICSQPDNTRPSFIHDRFHFAPFCPSVEISSPSNSCFGDLNPVSRYLENKDPSTGEPLKLPGVENLCWRCISRTTAHLSTLTETLQTLTDMGKVIPELWQLCQNVNYPCLSRSWYFSLCRTFTFKNKHFCHHRRSQAYQLLMMSLSGETLLPKNQEIWQILNVLEFSQDITTSRQ